VRFGKVHVYNNYYKIKHGTRYSYSWGVGIESQIFAQNNFFWTNGTETPDQFIDVFKGTAIHVEGTLVDGPADKNAVDVLAAYNAANDPDLSGDVGWTPVLFVDLERTRHVLLQRPEPRRPLRLNLSAGSTEERKGWTGPHESLQNSSF